MPTDKTPVQLWYVPSLDQVWVLNWRDEEDIGVKMVQMIENAAQKKKHRAIRPEPIDAQFDVIQNIFIPEPQVDEASVWSLSLVTDPLVNPAATFICLGYRTHVQVRLREPLESTEHVQARPEEHEVHA